MDFSVEVWACIDVVKICPHIDLELKYAQTMFRQTGGNVKSSSLVQRKKYIRFLKRFDLLPREEKNEIDFFDIINQAIKNDFFELSKQLLRRHVLRDRIHENNNKVLITLIQKKNNDLIQYLLALPKVKATLADPKNSVLMAAVLRNMVEVVDFLLAMPEIKNTVHKNRNAVLFEAMRHPDLIIFRKLILLPKVKENFTDIIPKIYEFLNPEILAHAKIDLGLAKFSESEIIDYAVEVSRAGHVLGLSDSYLPSDTIFPMCFSGTYNRKSLGWILENLRIFLRNTPASELKRKMNIVFSVFKSCESFRERMFDNHYRERPLHTVHVDLFNLFLQNKMIYLISGWEGHSVGIVLYKINSSDVVIAEINRGENGEKNLGSKIYKATKPRALTADWIRKIQTTNTYEEFSLLFSSIINVDKPLLSLPQTSQKYPICGYANKIAAIESMLLLLRAKFSGQLFKTDGLQKIFDQYRRTDYKKISSAFRDQEVTRIIGVIRSRKFHTSLMYDLVRSIILQHPGRTDRIIRPEKFQVECQRARRLLRALPEWYQSKFKKIYPDLYHLIDFEAGIHLPQKSILMDYQRKKAQSRALSYYVPTSQQVNLNLVLKYRY